MAREPIIVKQLDAMQLKIESEGKLTINSKMLPEVVDWKVGEVYRLSRVEIRQISSRELQDGVIEGEFEIIGAESR